MAAPTRKRKAHRKSRAGCRNCKLRRVKCDEARPACHNCIGFLVTCNYDSTPSGASSNVVRDGDLNFSMSEINVANNALVTDFNRMVTSQYPETWDAGQFRALNTFDIDRLKRWHTRTVFTLGTEGISMCYQFTVCKEITQYPYLLHAVLAMTAMHDGHLQIIKDPNSPDDSISPHYYHLGCAAALFNERLSKPIDRTADRNAIWTTASILGNMASFSVPTTDPELSWPLTSSPDESDLKWIEIYSGLSIIYQLSTPTDPGGLFHLLVQEPSHTMLKSKWNEDLREGIEDIPASFVALCDLTPTSNSLNNPYHATVRLLAAIWDMECTRTTVFRFLSFILLMRQPMKDLLMQKDARALLLLAYWYTKMFHAHWWFQKRAIIECNAICIYLKRYHSEDPLLMDMVQTPLERLAELASDSLEVR